MSKEKAKWIVGEQMLAKDAFSQWLGIQVEEIRPGFAELSMRVRPEMTNGFGIAHGGICYSLADTALAFAANAHGPKSRSINTSIVHTLAVAEGEKLLARAEEEYLHPKLAHYKVHIYNGKGEQVAIFQGSVYRSSKSWTPEELA